MEKIASMASLRRQIKSFGVAWYYAWYYRLHMRHLLLIFIGLIVAAGFVYFVGYDHVFKNAERKTRTEYEKNAASDAVQVKNNLVGMWQGVEDPKFTTEIRNDGVVIDRYEGRSPDLQGLWMVFTKEIPDATYTDLIEEGAVYLSVTMSEGEKHYFRITKADGNALDLVYLDREGTLSPKRGETLSFKRMK